jgi:hypothetical protein
MELIDGEDFSRHGLASSRSILSHSIEQVLALARLAAL